MSAATPSKRKLHPTWPGVPRNPNTFSFSSLVVDFQEEAADVIKHVQPLLNYIYIYIGPLSSEEGQTCEGPNNQVNHVISYLGVEFFGVCPVTYLFGFRAVEDPRFSGSISVLGPRSVPILRIPHVRQNAKKRTEKLICCRSLSTPSLPQKSSPHLVQCSKNQGFHSPFHAQARNWFRFPKSMKCRFDAGW